MIISLLILSSILLSQCLAFNEAPDWKRETEENSNDGNNYVNSYENPNQQNNTNSMAPGQKSPQNAADSRGKKNDTKRQYRVVHVHHLPPNNSEEGSDDSSGNQTSGKTEKLAKKGMKPNQIQPRFMPNYRQNYNQRNVYMIPNNYQTTYMTQPFFQPQIPIMNPTVIDGRQNPYLGPYVNNLMQISYRQLQKSRNPYEGNPNFYGNNPVYSSYNPYQYQGLSMGYPNSMHAFDVNQPNGMQMHPYNDHTQNEMYNNPMH